MRPLHIMPRVRPVHTSTLAPADTMPPSEPATAPTTRTQAQQHQQEHKRNTMRPPVLSLTCEDINNTTESTRPSSTRTLPELCVRSIRYHSCDHVLPAQFAPTVSYHTPHKHKHRHAPARMWLVWSAYRCPCSSDTNRREQPNVHESHARPRAALATA